MSNLERSPRESSAHAGPAVALDPVHDVLAARRVPLGEASVVRRLLPHRGRRMIGPWCFLDHFGPDDVVSSPGMRVPPHPHIGLQTVTWLVEGEVLHRDSLGHLQAVRPGELNLMTSGRGIAHSEESPLGRPPVLHGLQLWVALPDSARNAEPGFAHYRDLPQLHAAGVRTTVVMGQLAGRTSPALTYSPLVAADVELEAGADALFATESGFEYGALVVSGAVEVDGVESTVGHLIYLGCGRSSLSLRANAASRVFVLGGEPFGEDIVMWWNFVARTHDEIAAARDDWQAGRFGLVRGYAGAPLAAPELPPLRLKPRGS
jgi:quercetin 2,3-dioxygenase